MEMESETISRRKKIVLACSMDEDFLENLGRLREMVRFNDFDWYFVHIALSGYYLNDLVPFSFPDEKQRKEIEKIIGDKLNAYRDKIMPEGNTAIIECLFSTDPKVEMLNYLKEIEAQLVVVSTKAKAGIKNLFTSSFAEYMVRHSPCDVLVLRPEEDL